MFLLLCYNPFGMLATPAAPLSLLMDQTHQIFFPRNTTNEMGYQVKPQSPNSRPPSHYTFPHPMSPKSPVNFVQYHQQHQQEYPSIEVDYVFPRATSRARMRQDRKFKSLDFEVGLREDNVSSYSEAPPYHQYPEEDRWEDWGRGRRTERESPKADLEVLPSTTDGGALQLSMAVLEDRPRRGEGAILPPQPPIHLHPYVRALTSTLKILWTNIHDCRSPPSLLPLVSCRRSNERGKT